MVSFEEKGLGSPGASRAARSSGAAIEAAAWGGATFSDGVRLLPCPFCGDDEHLFPSHRHPGGGKPYAIDCVRCGFDFTPREGMDVVALWNKRGAPIADEAGQFRTALERIAHPQYGLGFNKLRGIARKALLDAEKSAARRDGSSRTATKERSGMNPK